MSCPFYGMSLIMGLPGGAVLVPTEGNQCALMTAAHAPCYLETERHLAPDWERCPRNPEWLEAKCAQLSDPKPEWKQ